MIKLLACEFKKFKSTYINSLSLIGMMTPTMLVVLMFIIKRQDMIRSGIYTWDVFNQYITLMFIFLVGPIITSFIATVSVFYEYQQKTMKNILVSPNGRFKIICSKMIYVSIMVVLLYILVAAVSIIAAKLLGIDVSLTNMLECCKNSLVSGLATLNLVPMMMFIALLTKNFIPPMVITVVGTIGNMLVLNSDKAYLSPFALPSVIMMSISKQAEINLLYPMISIAIFFIVFFITATVYFKNADQSV